MTRFLERGDIRAQLRQEFPKPKLPKAADLLAPPQSRGYGLIGTAFDYVLRLYAQRLKMAVAGRPINLTVPCSDNSLITNALTGRFI